MWQSIKQFFKDLAGFLNEPDPVILIGAIPKVGDKSLDVEKLQIALIKHGASIISDGVFGPLTKTAVAAFQKSKGLPGSGIPGLKTVKALGLEVSSAPPQKLKDHWNVARAEIGVKEIKGSKHNPRIIEYHSTTGKFSDDETSWCSSFVQWVLLQVGIIGTGSAAARSWLQWGTSTDSPKQGDIVVLWRVSPDSWQGHVGFFSHFEGDRVFILGGNQSDAVNISGYPRSRVLSFRKV